MTSVHKIVFANSSNLKEVEDESIDFTLTSPPYPMVEMWNPQFSQLNPEIKPFLEEGKGHRVFELMHQELDKTWNECYRALKTGGIACINIGDATRKIGPHFQLFSNHTRILSHCVKLGFSPLPEILWRKQSNAPNKFMGSGMLPPNAYVTHEHEYILVLRKGGLRKFASSEKDRRDASAYFWEERNTWFSDIWFDLKGVDQRLKNGKTRLRSGAFPFELAYRLINMYSIQGDRILDPFLGTGTTVLAAMASGRNSIGYEIDRSLNSVFQERLKDFSSFANEYTHLRLKRHEEFVKKRLSANKSLKYTSATYGFKVMTKQEIKIQFPLIKEISRLKDNTFKVLYQR